MSARLSLNKYNIRKFKEHRALVTTTCLKPHFHDKAKSVDMICHSLEVVKTAVDVLNPGQIQLS